MKFKITLPHVLPNNFIVKFPCINFFTTKTFNSASSSLLHEPFSLSPFHASPINLTELFSRHIRELAFIAPLSERTVERNNEHIDKRGRGRERKIIDNATTRCVGRFSSARPPTRDFLGTYLSYTPASVLFVARENSIEPRSARRESKLNRRECDAYPSAIRAEDLR